MSSNPPSSFTGYPGGALSLLTSIGANDKAFLAEHRKQYDADLMAPTRALVDALGPLLQESVSPTVEFAAKVNGSIAPINNDVRFARDKPPYKDHLLLRFWDGEPKRSAPTLFVHISEETVGFASGTVFDTAGLARWRESIAGPDGAEFAELLADVLRRGRSEVAGKSLKRVPAPYEREHERGELLKHKYFQVRWLEETPDAVGSSGFVEWCEQRLASVTALHEWQVAHLT